MLVAALSPNAQAANGLATFVVMVMSATGGAWYPMSLMPAFMQKVGKFTVVYWSMEGFFPGALAGRPLADVLPTIGVLAANHRRRDDDRDLADQPEEDLRLIRPTRSRGQLVLRHEEVR